MVSEHEDTRGWDAVEAAVGQVVRDPSPLHWGTGAVPEQAGIRGLRAYRGAGHWLLVTFGLTDLFGGEVGAEVSGRGFELTMRVPRTGEQPPAWALGLLDKLGQYVLGSEQPLAAGHRMDPGGPITGEPGTRLTALAFTEDPDLPRIDSVFGRAIFLTVVGITADELALMKLTSTDAVLATLPFVTDPAR